MASGAQAVLEGMVPGLEALERAGWFSRAELRSVVARRTDFEYRVRRRAPRKVDFVAYLDYECALEELRQLRKGERKKTAGGGGAGRAVAAADVKRAGAVLVKGIHFVFARALRRFQGDLRLWRRYFDFCKAQGGGKALGRALARALQLHPAEPGLWTEAADWEFNGRRNPAAARALMQRGLRVCGARAPQLWASYFQLELQYARQLQVRQGVVGLDVRPGERAAQALLDGAAAQAVLKAALKKLGPSAGLCERFLAHVRGFSADAFPEVEAAVLEAAASELAGDPEAWDLRARAALGDGEGLGAGPLGGATAGGLEGLERAGRLYDAGLEATGHAVAMYELYAAFAARAMEGLARESQSEGGNGAGAREAGKAAEAWARQALTLHEIAETRQLASTKLIMGRIELFEAVGRTSAARKAALGGLEAFPNSEEVWRKCWDLHAVAPPSGPGRGVPRRVRLVYEAGLASLSSAHFPEVATCAADFAESGCEGDGAWLTSPLEARLLGTEPLGRAEARHLQEAGARVLGAVRSRGGLGAARAFYGAVLARPGPAVALFESALKIEEEAAFGESGRDADHAACGVFLALHEQCLLHHGAQAWKVWLSLVRTHERLGEVERADASRWRARQALKDPEPFKEALDASDSEDSFSSDGPDSGSEEHREASEEPELVQEPKERPRRQMKRREPEPELEQEPEPEPERPRRRRTRATRA